MKILSATVKIVDDKNHVRILHEDEVDITIKGAKPNPIAEIPEIQEPPKPAKKTKKKK